MDDRFHDVVHGSPEWFLLRLARPTASEFSNIITPKTMKFSAQADGYADAKIAEMMTGEAQTGPQMQTYYMERGAILEAEAREAYEFTHSVQVSRGGFMTDAKGLYGASADFLVGDNGCGEIKCLMPKNHIKYLIANKVDPDNIPQVQGQLLTYEREWCDWWCYHPDLPRFTIRTFRDEKFIKALTDCLNQFNDLMSAKIEKLQATGQFWIADSIKKKESINHDVVNA